uniref:General transcription factor IIF subunit 2 n=1 Tax=Panagrolaimus superbus TaxID=310955 RepID=A0A914XZ56_9BILA
MTDTSSSSSRKRANTDFVDCERATRGVWLVKVPRYLSEIWEKNEGSDVGRLVQLSADVVKLISTTPEESSTAETKPSINGSTSSTARKDIRKIQDPSELKPIIAKNNKNVSAPKEHSFKFRNLDGQSLGVILEDKSHLKEDVDIKSGKLACEGRVVIRAECQPPNSEQYMKMKMDMFRQAKEPVSKAKQIDRAVVAFKPKAQHAENLKMDKTKKEVGARNIRAGREQVMDRIFDAFEKHQYYRLSDLQTLIQQPQGYLREILNDIAIYNTSPPHKSMWELKPEYRAYRATTGADDPMEED